MKYFTLMALTGLWGLHAAPQDPMQSINAYKQCIHQYDSCISDLLEGLGSMDGDDLKNCQEARSDCEKSWEEKYLPKKAKKK